MDDDPQAQGNSDKTSVVDDRSGWLCPDCGSPNPADAQRCAQCGLVLAARTPTPGSGPTPSEIPPFPPVATRPNHEAVAEREPVRDGRTIALGPVTPDDDQEPSGAPISLEPHAGDESDSPGPAPDNLAIDAAPESVEPIDAKSEPATQVEPATDDPSASAVTAIIELPESSSPRPDDQPAPPNMASTTAKSAKRLLPAVVAPPATPSQRAPGRLARTSPESLLLVGAAVSVGAWLLIGLDEAANQAGPLGFAGLVLCAVGIYILAVGLVQVVLRRGGRRY